MDGRRIPVKKAPKRIKIKPAVTKNSAKKPSKEKSNEGDINIDNQEQNDKDVLLGEDGERIEFEDPFDDEEEVEEIDGETVVVNNDDEEEEDEKDESTSELKQPKDALDMTELKKNLPKKTVYLPGDVLDDDEAGDIEWEYDPTAYDSLYRFTLDWPALSFDFFADNLGMARTQYPHSLFFVAGTQASQAQDHKLSVVYLSNMYQTKHEEEDDEESSDEELDEEPVIDVRSTKHPGCCNRVRSMPQQANIVASWSDRKKVHIWNTIPLLSRLQKSPITSSAQNSLFASSSSTSASNVIPFQSLTHKDEGFALDWSPFQEGHLITGDCSNNIYLWKPGKPLWECSQPFRGHTQSVEDIQFSPSESAVFTSCSADGTVKVWDTRTAGGKAMLSVNAHTTDVNVISWNKKITFLLVSGADDGGFKIWDLRTFSESSPSAVSTFNWHRSSITSVEWSPWDESVLAVSEEDGQVAVWDLALEEDPEAQAAAEKNELKNVEKVSVPPQLLFIHQGQDHIKEVHWHSQIPHMLGTTALSGFNMFKAANL